MTEREECYAALIKPQMTMKDVAVVLKAKMGHCSTSTVKNLWNSGQLCYHVRRPANADRRFDTYSHQVRGTRYSTPSDVHAYLKRQNIV